MPGAARRRRAERARRSEGSTALILAGRALTRGKLQHVEIAIDDAGRIQSVAKAVRGEPRHDVGDAVILPAATDLHVHFREPGGPAGAETFSSGTIGAALGGVSLVGEMPNTHPPVTDLESWQEKADLVHGRAAVDVLLYAAPVVERALPALSRHAGGFKVYLSPTTGIESVPAFADLPALWDRLVGLHLPVSVHAEDPTRFVAMRPPSSAIDWNAQRPGEAEEAALAELTRAPRGLRLHAAHVTTPVGVRTMRRAALSFEATPHHLLLSDRAGPDASFKVNPPLRSETERAGLWEAFVRGEVPIVASDHAPHTREAKALPFDQAPSGVPGVETLLPVLLSKVRSGDLDLAVLQAAACERPALWLGQPLGRLVPGHRANLLVVDFTKRSRVEGPRLRSPCGWTPFEGWEAIRPREHYRDGVRIVEDGEYVGRPQGQVVRPEYAPGEAAGAPTPVD